MDTDTDTGLHEARCNRERVSPTPPTDLTCQCLLSCAPPKRHDAWSVVFLSFNRRPYRLWWRRRPLPPVPRTRVAPALVRWAPGAARPPLPPPPRAPGASCRGSFPGEGSSGRARLRVPLTGKRAARASDDAWSMPWPGRKGLLRNRLLGGV